MHAIFMCPNDYVLHACSALSNLKAVSLCGTMLVHTSGLAKLTSETSGSSKNLLHGGKGQRWTIQPSLKQYLTSVSLSPTNVVTLMVNSSVTIAS